MPRIHMADSKLRLEGVKAALRHWDPIGVIDELLDMDLPPDEYDSYALYLLELVESGAPARRIASHLVSLRTTYMGLGERTATEFEEDLAERLVEWRECDYRLRPDFRFLRHVSRDANH